MESIEMDGSQGEGGGQILRSSLTLAALLGRSLHMRNIRAGRQKSGLLRQHLAAVRAVVAVTDGRVEGAELGSQTLHFEPGAIRTGHHTFSVGSAGSATLVCQTVLPLLLGGGESELVFEGGTHNPMAPPYDFLEAVYFPILRRMGVQLEVRLERAGFYPSGGGRMIVEVSGPRPGPLPDLHRSGEPIITAWMVSAGLAEHVSKRALAVVREGLAIGREAARLRLVPSPGIGGAVCIHLQQGDASELVTAFAQKNRPAEVVAADAVQQAQAWLAGSAPVGEHLADMLVLLAGLFGGGFHTQVWSAHTDTHVQVLRAFLGADAIEVTEAQDGYRVSGAKTL